jgi:tRNA-(ms[2]io[6]A)-hydroxylase
VLREPLALLSDHAYLERKAASNALELMNRWPDGAAFGSWAAALSAVARDEAVHLGAVVRLLDQRGGRLERTHHNPYARGLRELVRMGRGHEELLDRLLVSALIEARSCERFGVLARRCRDRELARFYRSLWGSELGHHRAFLALAATVAPAGAVSGRWAEMLEAEARLLARQPPGPRMHSGH